MPVHVAELWVYPVKSCRGFRLERARLDARGISSDRKWMIVDAATGQFLTQRELPRMALIGVALGDGTLTLSWPGAGEVRVEAGEANDIDPAAAKAAGREIQITVWVSKCAAIDCGDEAAEALTAFLRPEKPCRLVRMKRDDPRRTMDGKSPVSFVDAYPLLVVSEASLADLNSRMAAPVEMDRFRPNLVVAGCGPYEEDAWKTARAGSAEFTGAFPCIRCALATVDQATAERGPEPLATLAEYRKAGFKVIFGKYFYHAGPGEIAVGDEVVVEPA